MELRQLEHFVAVADESNFTRAAGRLHITQSGLSSSIKSLERELGAKLIERTTRRIGLTAEGRLLYTESLRILAATRNAERIVRSAQGVREAPLRIGSVPAMSGLNLSAALGRMCIEHPLLQVRLTVRTAVTDLFDLLLAEQLDMAFLTMPQHPPRELQFQLLATHPVVLVCPPTHRLAQLPSVSISDLEEEDFIDFSDASAARIATEQAFVDAGISRNLRVVCDEIGALLELVSAGVGLALVPRPLAQASRVPLSAVSLREENLTWTVALARLPGPTRTPAATAFLRLVESQGRPIIPVRQ